MKNFKEFKRELHEEKTDFTKGVYVILKASGKVGSIVDISGDKSTADVKFNDGKMKTVEISNLKLMKK